MRKSVLVATVFVVGILFYVLVRIFPTVNGVRGRV
jgi:hypothetical protein